MEHFYIELNLISVADCASKPCMHGGVCAVRDGKTSCICQPGYTDIICQTCKSFEARGIKRYISL